MRFWRNPVARKRAILLATLAVGLLLVGIGVASLGEYRFFGFFGPPPPPPPPPGHYYYYGDDWYEYRYPYYYFDDDWYEYRYPYLDDDWYEYYWYRPYWGYGDDWYEYRYWGYPYRYHYDD